MSKYTHCGFSDESSWNQGRYHSICLVTGLRDRLKEMNDALNGSLEMRKIQEFKWKGLDGANNRQAAIKMLHIAADFAARRVCRIDVLIWDTEDPRHRVGRRDDLQNFARMYYHLSRNVLRTKWSKDAVWQLLPDERHDIDWGALEQYLDYVSMRTSPTVQRDFSETSHRRYRSDFNVHSIRPVQSTRYRLVQLADLFAGLAVFSWVKNSEFRSWTAEQSGQLSFLDGMQCNASKVSRERFPVLQELIKVCNQRGFALASGEGGLKTLAYNAVSPINFWFYQPQSVYDKAPQRDKNPSKRKR